MRHPSIQIIFLCLLLLGVNAFSVDGLLEGMGMTAQHLGPYRMQQVDAAIWTLDAWLVLLIAAVALRRRVLGELFRNSIAVNGGALVAGLLLMLALNPLLAGRGPLLSMVLPLANLLLLAKAFHLAFVQAGQPAWRLRLRPLATAAMGLMAALLLLECGFAWVAKSQLNDNALASKVWFGRHWEINALGYREPSDETHINPHRRQLLFIGDSFLAGHGVADPADRFTDRIQALEAPHWQVHNHGQNGAATADELGQLWTEQPAPKLVVLCWFLNDIQPVAQAGGLPTGNSPSLPFAFDPRHHSYLLNYLYWLLPHTSQGENYLQFLHSAFGNPAILARHQAELRELRAAIPRTSRFAVVLFPMMNAVKESEFALRPMREFWEQEGAWCLDLTATFLPYAASELIVNQSDTHPNAFAHGLAADAISTFIAPLMQDY